MTDAQIIENVVDYCKMSQREFALEIGLSNAQTIYNIVKGKHGISANLAKMITDRFPEISYDFLRGRNENIFQSGDNSVNIQGVNSSVKTRDIGTSGKINEVQALKKEVKRLQQELKESKEREDKLMTLLLKQKE